MLYVDSENSRGGTTTTTTFESNPVRFREIKEKEDDPDSFFHALERNGLEDETEEMEETNISDEDEEEKEEDEEEKEDLSPRERFLAVEGRLSLRREGQNTRPKKKKCNGHKCIKTKRSSKKKKKSRAKPPMLNSGMEPVVPTPDDLNLLGRSEDEFIRTWVPPFPVYEKYQDNQYMLSGGIFQSASDGTCEHIAEMMGKCPWPCQLRGANDGTEKFRPKWQTIMAKPPKYKRDDPDTPCLVHRVHPPWPEPYKEKPGMFSKVASFLSGPQRGNTDESPFGAKYEKDDRCICVDPCSMYKTCQECTLIKQTIQTLPRTVGQSPWNCAWCENSCVSADSLGPSLLSECAGRFSYSYTECGATITPEDMFYPGPYVEPTPPNGGETN